jgi:hypothetical protein
VGFRPAARPLCIDTTRSTVGSIEGRDLKAMKWTGPTFLPAVDSRSRVRDHVLEAPKLCLRLEATASISLIKRAEAGMRSAIHSVNTEKKQCSLEA